MMNNKYSSSIAKAILLLSFASTSVLAIGSDLDHKNNRSKHVAMQHEKSDRFMQHKFKKLAKYLKLTKEQRQQAKSIHQQGKASRLALKESMQSFHQQSKTLTMADNFDEQAFAALQSEYQQTFTEMALIKAKTKHGFMQILTEEQKEKMKSFNFGGKKSRKHNL